MRDVLDSLHGHGFRRLVLVNGHGGNSPAGGLAAEWMAEHPETKVAFHNWWNAPRTWQTVQEIDSLASHGSWMESFPWNRVSEAPDGQKPMVDLETLRSLPPVRVRELIGDGNYGGAYQKQDEQMLRLWQTGVEETREAISRI